MKKIIFLLASVVCVFLSGCGVSRFENGFETSRGFKTEKGFSLIPNQERAIDIARAEQISSQATINMAIAKSIEEGKSQGATLTTYVGIIVNDNAKKTAYIKHPFLSQTMEVEPGECITITGPLVPEVIMVKFDGSDRYVKRKIYAKSTYYNGQKVDFGARIY